MALVLVESALVMDLSRAFLAVVLTRGWLEIEMFGELLIWIIHRARLLVGEVESVVGVVDLLLYPVVEMLVADSGILIASRWVPLPISL